MNAVLVLAMALGGMVVPTSLYLLFATDGIAAQGWGIPMATDTAFALGIMAMLGARVPKSAIVLLSALAIVDDIGAVLVISLFYTEQLNYAALYQAVIVLIVMAGFNLLGIRRAVLYCAGGVFLWMFIEQSGIHATTAGILAAMAVPARPHADTNWFRERITVLMRRFERLDHPDQSILDDHKQHEVVEQVQQLALKATTPLQHWGSVLDKPVSYLIIPLFVFLNAGVTLTGNGLHNADFHNTDLSVMSATIVGLVFGKGIGISLFAWLAIRFGIAKLPSDLRFMQVVGLSLIAGIGFTMSLFIATLAFDGYPELLTQAKIGILLGSLLSGTLGIWVIVRQKVRVRSYFKVKRKVSAIKGL